MTSNAVIANHRQPHRSRDGHLAAGRAVPLPGQLAVAD
jgi:hypothetical protein